MANDPTPATDQPDELSQAAPAGTVSSKTGGKAATSVVRVVGMHIVGFSWADEEDIDPDTEEPRLYEIDRAGTEVPAAKVPAIIAAAAGMHVVIHVLDSGAAQ